MATSIDKIQELEDELQYMDDKLCYYGELFNADGYISDEEDKKLKKMQASIEKAKAKLAKLKQIKRSNNRKLNAAKALIAELENVFVESNLELTPYTKLQDYSMDIATISGRIKASGVLERKAQKIIDRLDDWDKKIHQAIDKKVALIQQKKEKSKTKKKEVQEESSSPKSQSKTEIKIVYSDYKWIPRITGQLTIENEAPKKIKIKNLETTLKYAIPWNTSGQLKLTINLDFIFQNVPQKKHTKTEIVIIDFHVDEKGVFVFDTNKNISSMESGFSIESMFIDYFVGKIDAMKDSFNQLIDSKSFDDAKQVGKKMVDNFSIGSGSPIIDMITKNISKNRINSNISVDANTDKNTNKVSIKVHFKVGGISFGASLSPVNVGVDTQFSIPEYSKDNNVAAILFEVKKRKKETDNSSIKFEKNEVTLDKGDKNQLHRLIVEDFSKLVATKLKKDFPHKTFSTQEISMIRDLTLKQKNDEYYSIYLEGTTSCEGSEEINRKISKGRQNSVKEYLIELGVEPSNFVLSPPIGKLKCRKYMGSDEKEKDNPKEVSIVLSLKKLKMLSE